MQLTTTQTTNVNSYSDPKNEAGNEEVKLCDEFKTLERSKNLQFVLSSIHSATITLDYAAIRSAWAVIFSLFNASISTLATLSSRFSNSLRLHTQAIFASRLGLVETSIMSFFDASNSPCAVAKEHSPSLDIVDIDAQACNAFAWGGKNPSEWARSDCDLLVKVVWLAQSTSNLLCSAKMPFPKIDEIAADGIGRWCTMGHRYSMRAFISRSEPHKYLYEFLPLHALHWTSHFVVAICWLLSWLHLKLILILSRFKMSRKYSLVSGCFTTKGFFKVYSHCFL